MSSLTFQTRSVTFIDKKESKDIFVGWVPPFYSSLMGRFSLWFTKAGAGQTLLRRSELKSITIKVRKGTNNVHGFEYFLCGAVAKIAASCATYPTQVVRARMQVGSESPHLTRQQKEEAEGRVKYYKGSIDTIRKIWMSGVVCSILVCRNEGVAGFYKGIVPNVLRVAPSAAITFFVYEEFSKRFGIKT
jgi:hypothetical protein